MHNDENSVQVVPTLKPHDIVCTQRYMDYPYLFEIGNVDFNDPSKGLRTREMISNLHRFVSVGAKPYISGDKNGGKQIEVILERLGSSSSISLFGESDVEKAFKVINGGSDHANINIGFLNVRFDIKRFGNCVGVQVLERSSSSSDVHQVGCEVMNQMLEIYGGSCRQFKHSVEIVRNPFFGKQRGMGTVISFDEEFSFYRETMPWIKWEEDTTQLAKAIMDDYVGEGKGVVVGSYFGQEILFSLRHKEETDKTWRKGNIIKPLSEPDGLKVDIGTNGNDLKVVFSVNIGISPYSVFQDIDISINFWDQQSRLRDAVNMLYAGLYMASDFKTNWLHRTNK